MAESFPAFHQGVRLRALWKGLFLGGAVLSLAAVTARAVNIERVFVPIGDAVPGIDFVSLPQPNTVAGGGDFRRIIDTACDLWERALRDDFTVTLYFAWTATSSGRAEHYGLTYSRNPARETAGAIVFEASPEADYFFYLDPTPETSEEFRLFADSRGDYGGGALVHERRFFAPAGIAANPGYHDLLSVAVHEIGHALGLSYGHPGWMAASNLGGIAVESPLPLRGSILSLSENGFGGVTSHLDGLDEARLAMGLHSGTTAMRLLPTAADILAVAQLSGFKQVELDPHPVATAHAPGLVADYFAGSQELASWNGFDEAAPLASRTVPTIDALPDATRWRDSETSVLRSWGVRYIGAITIPRAGAYEFHLRHDGRVRVTLGDVALGETDGEIGPVLGRAAFAFDSIAHETESRSEGPREATIQVWLDAGFHFFALEHADTATAASRCELAWSGPGFERQPVPDAAFVHPVWAEITGGPVIVEQPTALRLVEGESGTLRIRALGLPEVDHQWRRDGIPLPSATEATLVLEDVTSADAGLYDCLVANDNGVIVSEAVRVEITE